MAKQEIKSNPRVQQIFEDLENYLDFCRDFGYKYDEADLYKDKSYVYRQYAKFVAGKPCKDQWALDAKSAT